ncbi:type IV secretion system protein VirB10 [Asticcacaulis tiandongensis]|uniref:type IV secretion system protein VirB10 n=1 Tax=Asticcacaulis tiandongensis TaxID=2565365 RepID=UPI00112E7477|nr:type IV secretion system protein VirB10 [Asticcacaulis tiandongensis]
MTTENTGPLSSLPEKGTASVNDTSSEEIVSVNEKGRRQNGQAGPLLMIGGVAAVVLVGGLLSLNVLKAKLSGSGTKPATEAYAPVSMTFDAETPPALPGESTHQTGNVQPLCRDGSPGNELRGADGVAVRSANGQIVRVCPDGQVVRHAPAQTQPIPVQSVPVAGQAYQPPAGSVPDTQRLVQTPDGFMMLNDGTYSQTQQGLATEMMAIIPPTQATVAQSRTEGLLTAPPRSGTLEAELIPSRTPLVQATRITNPHMLLPKGRSIDCGLSMRINSSLAGQASCVVTQNVYSASGKVVLIERGSEAVGEYRSGATLGQKRLFVVWTRIITPSGVVINLDSPAADELGSTGMTGKVDNHWWERIGAAFLLSTVQDAIQYGIAQEQAKSGGSTVVFGNTAQTGNTMADRVLQQSINIPPTLYKNQGDRGVIYVARDLDFSNVYRLRAD